MWEIAVRLAVACGVCDGVFLCCLFFPRGVLGEILNLIESVSEGFPSYSYFVLVLFQHIYACGKIQFRYDYNC